MAKEFRGVYSIPVTPFEEDGAVDYESLRRCVAFCVEAGAHGIVMPVNASEGPSLTDVERDEVLRTGTFETVYAADTVYAFRRVLGRRHAVVIFNTATEAARLSLVLPDALPDELTQVWPSDAEAAFRPEHGRLTMSVPAREAVVLVSGE